MGKLIKWLLGLLILLVVLVVAAIIVVPMVVDPNDYKDQIVAKVKEATGRDLIIRDRLGLSVFPSLAVQLGGVSLSNAPGFGDEPFAKVEKLDLRVKVMPLLSKRVEVDTVVLQGLGLNLAKDTQGKTNWEDLAGVDKEPQIAEETTQPGGAGDFSFAVQGVQIEDARVVWDDRQAGQKVVVDNVRVTTGNLSPGADVPVEAGLRLTSDAPKLSVVVGLDGTVQVNSDLTRYAVDGIKLKVDAEGEGLPKGGVGIELAGDLALDQSAGTMSLRNLAVTGPEVKITGQAEGSGLQDTPQINAQLALDQTNLKNLLGSFGIVIETTDPAALTQVSGDVGLKVSGGSAAVDPLTLKLDDSSLTGKVNLASFEGPVVRATLNLDQIDLDRYLPPPADQVPAQEAKAAEAVANPFAGLRTLDLDATVTVGKLKINNLRMSDMKAVVKSKQGVLRIDPAAASLYQGKFDGLVELDARKDTPRVRLKQALNGIQAGPLLKDLIGQDRLLGTGDVSSDISLVGLSEQQIRRSLNGNAKFAFRDGAVKGINLAEMIRNAKAALGMGEKSATGAEARTDFSELSASAVIENGVITNQDLQAKSPLLRVAGKGQVDLPSDSIDYLVTTEIVGSLEGQGGKGSDELKGVPIPVRLKGPLTNPKPTVDLEAALNATAKQKIEEKKEEIKAKAEEKIKDAVGDKLKGLFGK